MNHKIKCHYRSSTHSLRGWARWETLWPQCQGSSLLPCLLISSIPSSAYTTWTWMVGAMQPCWNWRGNVSLQISGFLFHSKSQVFFGKLTTSIILTFNFVSGSGLAMWKRKQCTGVRRACFVLFPRSRGDHCYLAIHWWPALYNCLWSGSERVGSGWDSQHKCLYPW